MNKPVRIPDMFLRATKRGATALLSDVSNVNSEDKKDEPVQLPIIKRPRVDGEFVLRDLLLDGDWKKSLQGELQKPYIKNIENFLRSEYAKGKKIFPPRDSIFAAFHHTPLKKVRVVIIGQDPYHDDGQAHGLSFSVPRGKSIPGSLRNIYKELATDIPGFNIPNHGNLEKWANQGVFLLNATLTVEAHQANSHSNIGWQQLTDAVIATSSRNCDKLVYVLWGGFAKKKEVLLDKKKHAIIQCAHPSPLSASRGFLGSRCFSRINEQLEKFGHKPIDWNLD